MPIKNRMIMRAARLLSTYENVELSQVDGSSSGEEYCGFRMNIKSVPAGISIPVLVVLYNPISDPVPL